MLTIEARLTDAPSGYRGSEVGYPSFKRFKKVKAGSHCDVRSDQCIYCRIK